MISGAPRRAERPVVGVTCSRRRGRLMWLFNRFAVWRAGGRARRLTPRAAASADGLDGLVIGGGDDIDASLYGGELEPTIRVDRQRDAFELALLRAADARGLPVLGICRGAQMINVFRGGTLHESIYEAYDGLPRVRTPLPRKTIRVARRSRLERLLHDSRRRVNALHHQSIDRLGSRLAVVARDEHGVVQAIEDDGGDGFVLGVQWHPEFLIFDRGQQRLFKALIDAARARRESVRRR